VNAIENACTESGCHRGGGGGGGGGGGAVCSCHFDVLDGTGKSTSAIACRMAARLLALGSPSVPTPGGNPRRRVIRPCLLLDHRRGWCCRVKRFLFMASRAQLTAEVNSTALDAGAGSSSPIATLFGQRLYQGHAGGLRRNAVGNGSAGDWRPGADLTIILDLSVELARKSAKTARRIAWRPANDYHARVVKAFSRKPAGVLTAFASLMRICTGRAGPSTGSLGSNSCPGAGSAAMNPWLTHSTRGPPRRLAHAYLFAGPEGVGKRLFAGGAGQGPSLCQVL